MTSTDELKTVSDADLLRRLADLVRQARRVEAVLIAHIAEVDARRLYIREAPSMFAYCTQVVCISRSIEAFARITTVARPRGGIRSYWRCCATAWLHASGIGKPRTAPHRRERRPAALHARRTRPSARSRSSLRRSCRSRTYRRRCARSRYAMLRPRRLNSVRTELPRSATPSWFHSRRPSNSLSLDSRFPPPAAPVAVTPLHRHATRCSSPRAPSCATSSSACRRSCARISRPPSRRQ